MLWITFSLKIWKQHGRCQKVGHSDLVMIRDTAPWLDVLSHQVWWSCIKQHKRSAVDNVSLKNLETKWPPSKYRSQWWPIYDT